MFKNSCNKDPKPLAPTSLVQRILHNRVRNMSQKKRQRRRRPYCIKQEGCIFGFLPGAGRPTTLKQVFFLGLCLFGKILNRKNILDLVSDPIKNRSLAMPR